MPDGRTWQVVAVSAVAGLAVSIAAVAAAGPWDSGQRRAERVTAAHWDHQLATAPASSGTAAGERTAAPAPAAGRVLTALGAPGGAVPTRQGLAERLGPLLADPALGTLTTASVVDAATGQELYGSGATLPSTPASTIKIATAVAALSSLGPGHRIATTVVASGDDRIVLVGGGDPTLDLGSLADDTAAALKVWGLTRVHLAYDASLYSGPVLHSIGRNDNVAPVSALMAHEGRLDDSDKGPAPRVGDPAAAAAEEFAGLLRARGIAVAGDPLPGPGAGTQLAAVLSPPLSALVERMLTNSDNDIAEALARQVAIGAGLPPSFSGGEKAVTAALRRLRLPLEGARFADGSGLSHADALSPGQLARLLALAADPQRPELRPVLTGLPVAGFTGTLTERFRAGAAASGAGLVRAKTGTLTGTNTIAGTVLDADGRLLAFAFMAQGATNADAARAALDRLGAGVAGCGCR